MSKIDELKARRDRIVGYIKDGWTADRIADAEGMEKVDARKQRKLIADEEGLTIPDSARIGFTPLGFGPSNHMFRQQLANRLAQVRGSPKEIATKTGLRPSEQRQASRHIWTIYQIQRLADALGMTFKDLVDDCNSFGVGFQGE